MDFQQPLILQNAPLTPTGNARLRELFAVVSKAELNACREQIAGLVTTGGVPVNAALIDSLPSLRVIATLGVGFDHIDLSAARKRGIPVSHTPGVLSDCVADLAFGALVAVSRQLLQADRFVRQEQWLQGRYPLASRVSGKRLGIVGLGRIGCAVAQRAKGFDMVVRYHSRHRKVDRPEGYEPSLSALAEWADFLVVCAPGGETTRHLISHEILVALGKNGFLINVSRGSLVDEGALIRALETGTIAGAALDVFADEPRVPEELIGLNNVVLLPHIASSTQETFTAMEDLLLDNLQSFFRDGRLVTPVPGG